MHCQQLHRLEPGIVTTPRVTQAEAPWVTRVIKTSLEMDCQAMPLADTGRLIFHLRRHRRAGNLSTTEKLHRRSTVRADQEFLISVRKFDI